MGRRVDSVSVVYRSLKGGGLLWEGGVDYVSVAYSGSEGVYSGGMGRLWEGRCLRGGGIFLKGGVDSGRAG